MIKKSSSKLSYFLLFVLWGLARLQSIHRIVRSTGTAVRYRHVGHRYAQATGANRFQNLGLALCLLPFLVSPAETAQAASHLLSAVQGVFKNQATSDRDRLEQLFLKVNAGTCADDVKNADDTDLTVFKRRGASQRVLNCIKTLRSAVALEAAASATTSIQLVAIDAAFSTQQEQVQAAFNEADGKAKFLKLNWGLGFGYSFADDDVIEDAEIVNGVVRSKKDATQKVRLVLEAHWYFWCNDNNKHGDRGCGPFLAVAADEDEVLSGVAVGFMFGRKSKQAGSKAGFSVGIGAILDADVKSLADGFEENKPPPAGETVVRFEEKDRWSAILFFTRTF